VLKLLLLLPAPVRERIECIAAQRGHGAWLAAKERGLSLGRAARCAARASACVFVRIVACLRQPQPTQVTRPPEVMNSLLEINVQNGRRAEAVLQAGTQKKKREFITDVLCNQDGAPCPPPLRPRFPQACRAH
jgi:hypothetical protein